MDPLNAPRVRKQGVLKKLGGGQGGHKNWRNRYFVLTDHLAYYTDQSSYAKDPFKPLGIISLNNYFCASSDAPDTFEFTIHAYPKPLVVRANDAADRDEWVAAIMSPLEDLKIPPYRRRMEREHKEQEVAESLQAAAETSADAQESTAQS